MMQVVWDYMSLNHLGRLVENMSARCQSIVDGGHISRWYLFLSESRGTQRLFVFYLNASFHYLVSVYNPVENK